jgi:hypothetical protein
MAAVMRGCTSLALIVSIWTSAPRALDAAGAPVSFSHLSASGMKSFQRTMWSLVPWAYAGACRAARMASIPLAATAAAAPETLMNCRRFTAFASMQILLDRAAGNGG